MSNHCLVTDINFGGKVGHVRHIKRHCNLVDITVTLLLKLSSDHTIVVLCDKGNIIIYRDVEIYNIAI